MYAYLEGKISSHAPGRLVLDVQGVGYEVHVPLAARFGTQGLLRVHVHQVVREDEHRLYGFPDSAMRDLFRLLLSVRGVGPAAALGLLSGLSVQDLVGAIHGGDVRKLVSVRGIGKKTAEQLLLDLREKIASFTQQVPGGGLARSGGSQRVEDAVAALVGIGFSEKEARKAVDRAAADLAAELGASAAEQLDVERLVRRALSG